MTDPLSLLRKFIIEKKPIKIENNHFIFENLKFPKNIETFFRSSTGNEIL